LYHRERVMELNIVPVQALMDPKHYHALLDFSLESFRGWTTTEGATQAVAYWNSVATVAILAEPCTYAHATSTFKWPAFTKREEHQKRTEEHWADVENLYQRIGLERLEQIRLELCIDAETLDPNREIQTLIAMARNERRFRYEGRLGGALHL